MPANKQRISHPLLRYNKEDNEIHSVTCAGCGAALVANAIFATVKKQLPFPVNLSMERVVALHLCAKFSAAYHFAKDQFPFTSYVSAVYLLQQETRLPKQVYLNSAKGYVT